MSSLEFALTICIVLVLFLAFALALTAALVASKQSQAEVRKLFQLAMKSLPRLLSKD